MNEEDKAKDSINEALPIAVKPVVNMPIKAIPYQHQIRGFNFAMKSFGVSGGDECD